MVVRALQQCWKFLRFHTDEEGMAGFSHALAMPSPIPGSKTVGSVQSCGRADLCFMAFFFVFVTDLFKGFLIVQAMRGDQREVYEKNN